MTFEYRLRLTERERRVIVSALASQLENLLHHQAAGIEAGLQVQELRAVLALVASTERYPFQLVHCPDRKVCPWAKPVPG